MFFTGRTLFPPACFISLVTPKLILKQPPISPHTHLNLTIFPDATNHTFLDVLGCQVTPASCFFFFYN